MVFKTILIQPFEVVSLQGEHKSVIYRINHCEFRFGIM